MLSRDPRNTLQCVMSSGERGQWGSRFCLRISCLGRRSSRDDAEPSGNLGSAARRNSAAKRTLPTLAMKIGPKEKAIAAAKIALQVAAAGLKTAPIPNLDQIPNVLLMLIQSYEVSPITRSPPRIVVNDVFKPPDHRWKQRETSRSMQISRSCQRRYTAAPSVFRRWTVPRDRRFGE